MSYEQRRKSIRFTPDLGDFARIDFEMRTDEFTPQIVALVVEESAKGCCLVVTAKELLKQGDHCKVQVGKLQPIKAEVRWRKELDVDVFKIGFMYLE